MNDPVAVADVAHEMGHIFGLVHEQQRPDRKVPFLLHTKANALIDSGDNYIHFDCTKLYGYEDIKKRVNEAAHLGAPTIEQVCAGEDGAAEYYGWAGPDAYKLDFGEQYDARHPVTFGPSYDRHSIMGYGSTAYSGKGEDAGVTELPLVWWKNGKPVDDSKPNAENAELISTNLDVSDGDAEGIKAIYPW